MCNKMCCRIYLFFPNLLKCNVGPSPKQWGQNCTCQPLWRTGSCSGSLPTLRGACSASYQRVGWEGSPPRWCHCERAEKQKQFKKRPSSQTIKMNVQKCATCWTWQPVRGLRYSRIRSSSPRCFCSSGLCVRWLVSPVCRRSPCAGDRGLIWRSRPVSAEPWRPRCWTWGSRTETHSRGSL